MPLTLDRVKIAGLTVPAAEKRVKEAIQPYVKHSPKVWLEMARPDSRYVYVMGAVSTPGKIRVGHEKIYVREAVARAGWPLRSAALKRTKLTSSSADVHATRQIDLKAVLYDGDLRENYELKPGDIVWVPRSYVSEFAWHARQILDPFAVLIGYGDVAENLAELPDLSIRRSNRSNNNNDENEE